MAAEAKIDDEEAAAMLAAGTPVRDIAKHFDVSTQAVYTAIKRGRVPKPARKERAA